MQHTALRTRQALVAGLVGAALVLCALPTHAASPSADMVLLQGAGVSITAKDVSSDMQRMPAHVRSQVLAQPDQLKLLIENLYLRRALAAQAERDGTAQKPDTQYRLRIAREGALADARLQTLDDSVAASTQAIDVMALNIYKAEPTRFEAPARTRASHILIEGNSAASRAQAEELLGKIKAGASFQDLARQYSRDPGSAGKGGNLGFYRPGSMVKPFEEAVDALKNPGDLAPVTESQFGLHIIRLDERKPAGVQSFDEVQDMLRAEVRGKVLKEARTKIVDDLRQEMNIDQDALAKFVAQEETKK